MEEEVKKLKELVEASERILVISHVTPDPDALCSVLLCGTTLSANYPDKKVFMSSEELTGGLEYLQNYSEIIEQPLLIAIGKHKPDLIIMLDAMNYGRCTRQNASAAAESAKSTGAKLVIIDHHEPVDVEDHDIYINQNSPATVQDVYEVFFDKLKLKKPKGYAQTAMVGLLSDTGRFLYENPRHRDTFKLVSDLIDEGTSIENLENMAARYTVNELQVVGELAHNLVSESGYNYSFISDEFTDHWVAEKKSGDELKLGCEIFVSGYIRNAGDNLWGFIVYPELAAGNGRYSASFRALSGVKDVSVIARSLGGGGHKGASGAKFDAESVMDAVDKVKTVIKDSSPGS